MTYKAGEALLLTQIRATTPFSATNTSIGDYSILGKSANVWAILYQGAGTHNELTIGGGLGGTITYETNYTTIVQVHSPLKINNTAMYTGGLNQLADALEAIMNRFEKYPHAGDTTGTLRKAWVSGFSDVYERANARAVFVVQDITISWIEERKIVQAE